MTLFGTAGIRGSVETDVTPELAVAVGRAVGRRANEDGRPVAVGRDGRTTGAGLADAVASGVVSGGADVRRVGVVPTPALAFASRGGMGVMVTASHNPPTDNGLKLFADATEFDREAERDVVTAVEAADGPVPWDEWCDRRDDPVLPAYREAVVDYARGHGAPLDGLRVAVDCGNGVGSIATPDVLESLGARVVAINANVDGHFPGRESKPTPESLAEFRGFVAESPVALGLAHDGDADRIVVVDDDGAVVHEDTVVAVLAEHYVRTSDAVDPVVVTTPNASARVDERVDAAGGRVERVRLGALHEGMARVREDGGTVVFAAEPWKHVHPALGGWIDGVASAAVLARLVASTGLDGLRAPVTERPYRKVSVPCPDEAKEGTMRRVETALPEAFPDASVDTDYGVRLDRPDGSWVLVRPSGTEPYVRLYAESESVDDLVASARAVLEAAVDDATGS